MRCWGGGYLVPERTRFRRLWILLGSPGPPCRQGPFSSPRLLQYEPFFRELPQALRGDQRHAIFRRLPARDPVWLAGLCRTFPERVQGARPSHEA